MYFIPGCAMGHEYTVDNSFWSKYIIFYIYILHISYFAPNIIFLVQWGRIDILLTAPSWSKWPHLNIETSVPLPTQCKSNNRAFNIFQISNQKMFCKSALCVYFSLQSMQHVQFTHLNIEMRKLYIAMQSHHLSNSTHITQLA